MSPTPRSPEQIWKPIAEARARDARRHGRDGLRPVGGAASLEGVEIDTAGDGFLATFDGPARAVRCARAIGERVRDLGIEIRAGVHVGEIEHAGNNIRGIAVHIGARVASLAGPSEILASSTVRDLVAGSGLVFEDRGEHELKGVPDPWHLYAVASEGG